jgi:Mg2+ and Co2+ transporter CorA
MAYSLMDSVVDAFFPIMDYVDYEANELDVFSVGPRDAPPEEHPSSAASLKTAPSGVGLVAGHKVYDDSVVGIQIDSPSDKDLEKLSQSPTSSTVKRATVERLVPVKVLRGAASAITVPARLAAVLPSRLTARMLKPFKTKVLVDQDGIELQNMSASRSLVPDGVSVSAAAKHTLDAVMLGKTPRERAVMLQRITQMRRIVTGLSRLLGPKTDVVRGLRKRVLEEDAALFRGDFKHDIAVYIGDLQGEFRLLGTYEARVQLNIPPPDLTSQTTSSPCSNRSSFTMQPWLTITPRTSRSSASRSSTPSATPTLTLSSCT